MWSKNIKKSLKNQKEDKSKKGIFCDDIVKTKSNFWVSDMKTSEIHPFVQCLHMALYGKMDQEEIEKMNQSIGLSSKIRGIHHDFMESVCEFYKTRAIIFKIQFSNPKYAEFKIWKQFGLSSELSYAFLFDEDKDAWGWMIPSKKGEISLLKFKRCNLCSRWRKDYFGEKSFKNHLKKCQICICGQAYQSGGDHETHCRTLYHRKTKKFMGKTGSNGKECKMYTMEKSKKASFRTCYFADFEAFPDKTNRNAFQIYASGLLTPKELNNDKTIIFTGKKTMDLFMNYLLENAKGTLWFFNGSRFDAIFMIKWCVMNDIPMLNSLMQKGAIVSFEIKTKKGSLAIKDLARFLPCSLDANCKSFGVSANKSKTDFDHSKIKNWDDVEKFKVEYSEYLRLDVVSLREVYQKFANQIFTDYQVHVCKFLTMSHLSYAVLTTKLKSGLLFKTPHCYIDIMRETYRGGRIICGRKRWKSVNFDEVMKQSKSSETKQITRKLYDEIEDYLCYLDVNSLYPSVMVNRNFPCGLFKSFTPDMLEMSRMIHIFRTRNKEMKQTVMKRIFKVDIECPNDIMIPFLMSREPILKSNGERNEKKKVWEGTSTQNLNPKKEAWYTGPELWEAYKLGYSIVKIYEWLEWDKHEPIFHDFIIKANEQKTNSPKDSPAYQTAKNSMNGVTGKFGQKGIEKIKTHMTKEEVQSLRKSQTVKNVVCGMEAVISDKNEVISYIVEMKKEENMDAPFAIHLSSFILAESKVFMSKLIRKMRIQKDEYLTPIYSDTDSYILHKKAADRLPEKFVGKNLGQLKHEIDGKIIGCVVIAPKTYQIIYVGNDLKIYCMMRCKGIPHISESFLYYDNVEMITEGSEKTLSKKEVIEKMLHIYSRKNGDPCDNVIMKEYYYMEVPFEKSKVKVENRDREWFNGVHFYRRINFDACYRMISGVSKIECLYPQFNRSTHGRGLEQISVTPDWSIRTVFNTIWWDSKSCNRKYPMLEKSMESNLSAYPIGHKALIPTSMDFLMMEIENEPFIE